MTKTESLTVSRCSAVGKNDAPCMHYVKRGQKYCDTHDPVKIKEREEQAHRIAVDLASRKMKINTVEDVVNAQAKVLERLMNKPELNTKDISSFATISNSFIRARMESIKLDKLAELESQVKSLSKKA